MDYKIVKMSFPGGVHFGNRMLSDGVSTCMADTLFSALCQEAVRTEEGVEGFVQLFKDGRLRISDTMPFVGEELYLPKPFCTIETDTEGDSVIKKAYKKLNYIPVSRFETYLSGNLDPVKEQSILGRLGQYEMRTNAAIGRGTDAEPYQVGVYRFAENNGLYFCVGYEDKEAYGILLELVEGLSISGIGGRRSQGLGRFEVSLKNCPEELKNRLTKGNYSFAMSLSISLPDEAEMEQATQDSSYGLVKRSGYVASFTYADEYMKKRDFYAFTAGSVFQNQYKGNLYDVSENGKHPVYRYAFPMFLGLK